MDWQILTWHPWDQPEWSEDSEGSQGFHIKALDFQGRQYGTDNAVMMEEKKMERKRNLFHDLVTVGYLVQASIWWIGHHGLTQSWRWWNLTSSKHSVGKLSDAAKTRRRWSSSHTRPWKLLGKYILSFPEMTRKRKQGIKRRYHLGSRETKDIWEKTGVIMPSTDWLAKSKTFDSLNSIFDTRLIFNMEPNLHHFSSQYDEICP